MASRLSFESMGSAKISSRDAARRSRGAATSKFGVAGVEIQAVPAWNERERRVEVGAEFLGGACLARVASGDSEAAPGRSGTAVLESANVFALPAVQGNRDGGQTLQ